MKTSFLAFLTLTLLLLSACAPKAGSEGSEADTAGMSYADSILVAKDRAAADSMVLLYDRLPVDYYWDGPVHYSRFVEEHGALSPILRMRISTPGRVAEIDSCLKAAKPRPKWRRSKGAYQFKTADAEVLLLRYKGGRTDTVAIEALPGLIQVRDTVYLDSLVFHHAMAEIAGRDTAWLNRSYNGAIMYKSIYLNRDILPMEYFCNEFYHRRLTYYPEDQKQPPIARSYK